MDGIPAIVLYSSAMKAHLAPSQIKMDVERMNSDCYSGRLSYTMHFVFKIASPLRELPSYLHSCASCESTMARERLETSDCNRHTDPFDSYLPNWQFSDNQLCNLSAFLLSSSAAPSSQLSPRPHTSPILHTLQILLFFGFIIRLDQLETPASSLLDPKYLDPK